MAGACRVPARSSCAPPEPRLGLRLARRGRARRFSDLDLAIDAGRPLTIGDGARLSDAFEESALPWRVDVVDLATCSEAFRAEIEGHAVLLLAIESRSSHDPA